MLKTVFPARLLAALSIAAALVTAATPSATAQTTPVLTVAAKLKDGSPGDGKIVLSKKRGPFASKTAIRDEPCPITTLTPAYSYVGFGADCPKPAVTPPPIEEPPVVTPPVVDVPAPSPAYRVVTSGKERILLGKDVVFGLNEWGGIGTLYAAPAGVATARSYGFTRVGIYRPSTNIEASLNGRAIEGFNIGYTLSGTRVTYSNQKLTGYYQIPGAFDAAARWTGATATGLEVVQDVELIDDHLRFTVKMTNTTAQTMRGLRYMRTADFDTNSLENRYTVANSFSTNNSIPSRGTVLAGLRGMGAGTTAFLSSPAAGAVATFYGFVNLDPFAAAAYDAPQAVGAAKTSDVTSNVTIALGDLAPGATATVQVDMGLR